MSDIVAFLRARIDEDEQAACRAGDVRGTGASRAHASWSYHRERFEVAVDGVGWSIAAKKIGGHGDPICDVDGEHIARWDPARVLAEVEAKRRIIERHSGDHHCPQPQDPDWLTWIAGEETRTVYPCGDLRDLAASYADHPDYDPVWAVTSDVTGD